MFQRSKGAPSKSKPPKVDPLVSAKNEVTAFWAGNGSPESLQRAREALEALRLGAAQLDRLRLELPAATGPGTTAQKARRMDSLLLRLHAAA